MSRTTLNGIAAPLDHLDDELERAILEGFDYDASPITAPAYHAILRDCGDLVVTVKQVRKALERLSNRGAILSDFMLCAKMKRNAMHYYGKDWSPLK